MKQDAKAKKLAALLKKIKARKSLPEVPPRNATLQLVVACLQWQATRKQAEEALELLLDEMVDLNELRVSHPHEMLELLGEDYPHAQQRILRMRESLNEVFKREHGIEMSSLEAKNKKDQRAYLETLPGVMPYAVAQIMLLTFGGHAMPVDEKLVALLAKEGVVDDYDASPAEVEAYLLRHIKAGDAVEAHLLFQAWADALKMPAAPKTTTKAAPKKKTVKKKTTKKKTVKKKTTQRSATTSASKKKK